MKTIRVANIHTIFKVNQLVEAEDGVILLNEQIKAMQRFIRWHARQVGVGQSLLAQLMAQIPKTDKVV